jgi:hypothetical protein
LAITHAESQLNFKRIVREPLLHFLLIGAALFIYYGHHAPGGGDDRQIVISQQLVDDLAEQFRATWTRPPTAAELHTLVDTYVHDEVLYREGMEAGLAREDAVIKRRVRQKIEVMAEEDSEHEVATEADLQAYLAAHAESFTRPAVVSFEQVYFGPPTPAVSRQIEAARTALVNGKTAANLGQPTMLPRQVQREDIRVVSRDFGQPFADALVKLPVGAWSGPVTSAFGEHLVRLGALEPAVVPPLTDIRTGVTREWENERRQRAMEASYQRMRANYRVVLEAKLPPAP